MREYEYQPKINEARFDNWPLVEGNPELKTTLIASYKAGKLLRFAYHLANYEVYVKVDKSEYTPLDEQAEIIASENIKKNDPNAIIMGEEISPDEDVSSGDFWVIDGIDGTTNFSRGIPLSNFTMAKIENSQTKIGVVNDFLHHEMYYTVKDRGAYKNGKLIHVSTRPFSESVISFAPLRKVERGKWNKEVEAVNATWAAMQEITEASGRFHRELQTGGKELALVAEGKLDGYASSWTNPWDLSAGVLLVREAGGIATNIYGEDWQPSYMGVIAGNKIVHPEILRLIQKNFK